VPRPRRVRVDGSGTAALIVAVVPRLARSFMMRSPALPERAIVKGKLLTGVRKLDKTDGPGASASKGGVAVLKAPRKPPPENSPRPAPKVPKKGKFGSSRRTGV